MNSGILFGVAVIDYRFLQTFETRGRVCGYVFDFQITQYLDHQIRTGTLRRANDGRWLCVANIAVGGSGRLAR
jgi:hypothetical protein